MSTPTPTAQEKTLDAHVRKIQEEHTAIRDARPDRDPFITFVKIDGGTKPLLLEGLCKLRKFMEIMEQRPGNHVRIEKIAVLADPLRVEVLVHESKKPFEIQEDPWRALLDEIPCYIDMLLVKEGEGSDANAFASKGEEGVAAPCNENDKSLE